MLIDSPLHGFNSFSKPRVPVVLDGIISSTHELLGNETPFLILLVSKYEQHPLLLLAPLSPFYFRVQVVEPPFSAALSTSVVQVLLKIAPHHVVVTLSLVVYIPQDYLILMRYPVSD